MPNAECGPLFEFRFRLRTMLCVVTAAGVILAFAPWLVWSGGHISTSRETQFRFSILMFVFLIFCFGLSFASIWLATRNRPRHLGIIIICHVGITLFLLVGPILSYHINGRAWYDYGTSGWNPPPFTNYEGKIVVGDYDPKFTRPAVWPVIGPIMFIMCWLSIRLMIFPPTAFVVSIALFVSALRLRRVLTFRQRVVAWSTWAFGLVPILYLCVWGSKVLEWLLD